MQQLPQNSRQLRPRDATVQQNETRTPTRSVSSNRDFSQEADRQVYEEIRTQLRERAELARQNHQSHNKIFELNEQLQKLQSHNNKLNESLKESIDERDNAYRVNKALVADNEKMNQRISQLEKNQLGFGSIVSSKEFEKRENGLKERIDMQANLLNELRSQNDAILKSLNKSLLEQANVDQRNNELAAETDRMRMRITEMEAMLLESELGALQSVRRSLKFEEKEKLTKPLICMQLEKGAMLYFDNVKPFELSTMHEDARVNADLKLLEGEYDCSFRGIIGNYAYFSTIRGKVIKFFKAGLQDGQIYLELIHEMKTSELSLFHNEPMYFIERSREWSLYEYSQNYTETEGEKFDISEIDLLSKYERHYHRGVLYLFRESAKATVRRVNAKVVRIEGPLLDRDVTSIYTPPHSDSIYVINSEENVLIIINTALLSVTQLCYEAPADSNNHSIVGIHDGILTMAFDGVWGRLSTTRLP